MVWLDAAYPLLTKNDKICIIIKSAALRREIKKCCRERRGEAQGASLSGAETGDNLELFKQIIHVDFIALITFIYLALFMRANRAYDKSVNKYYFFSLTLVAVLTIADNLDYYYSGLPEPIRYTRSSLCWATSRGSSF